MVVYWSVIFVFIVLTLLACALTAICLPGVWVLLAVCVFTNLLIAPDTWTWTLIASCLVLAMAGEIAEFVSGSIGTKYAGGSRYAALGALTGAVTGALAGAAFPPLIGSLIWAVIGAGIGAVMAEFVAVPERRAARRLLKVGAAAAAGRMTAMIAKLSITVIVGLGLTIGAIVP